MRDEETTAVGEEGSWVIWEGGAEGSARDFVVWL